MVLRVELSDVEGNRLHRLLKATRDVVVLRRAMVVMQSAQGYTPPRIAELMGLDAGYVREIVKAFNEGGFDGLNPRWGGGRPRTFTDEVRGELANLATSRPGDLGLPFQEWSLSRLRREAVRRGIVDDISTSWLAVILDEAALTYQQAKTWKESKDPRFAEKKKRVERPHVSETGLPHANTAPRLLFKRRQIARKEPPTIQTLCSGTAGRSRSGSTRTSSTP